MSNERLERIEAKIDSLIVGQREHTVVLTDHSRRLDKLEIGQEVLEDKVKQIAEGHAALVRTIDSGFQSIHAVLDERIKPLEQAVRRLNARQ